MPDLRCIVVTPEQTVRDGLAEFVALTLFDGEIGIAAGHAPMIGRLGSGEMRITHEEGIDRYYLEGGFVEVLGNVVSILTSRAIPAEELDEAICREQLTTARTREAHTPELQEAREQTVTRTRAQLRVARRAQD